MGFDNVNVNVSGPVQPTSTYKTKVLKGNHSFASQVTEHNMKYVIKYDFDLGGEEVEIPAGCILQFEGGSLSNGTLAGNDTVIDAGLVKILNTNIIRNGTWKLSEVYPEWFGAVGDGVTDDTAAIKACMTQTMAVYKPFDNIDGKNYPNYTVKFCSNKKYVISDEIIVYSGIIVDLNNSIIQQTSDKTAFHFQNNNNTSYACYYSGIMNGTIYGIGASESNGYGVYCELLCYGRVEKVEVFGFKIGFAIVECQWNTFNNLVACDNRVGLYLTSTAERKNLSTIDNSFKRISTAYNEYGIWIQRASFNTFSCVDSGRNSKVDILYGKELAGYITSINIINGGTGYTPNAYIPLTITDESGNMADCYAHTNGNGVIEEAIVYASGLRYSNPSIVINDTQGSGASFAAVLGNDHGIGLWDGIVGNVSDSNNMYDVKIEHHISDKTVTGYMIISNSDLYFRQNNIYNVRGELQSGGANFQKLALLAGCLNLFGVDYPARETSYNNPYSNDSYCIDAFSGRSYVEFRSSVGSNVNKKVKSLYDILVAENEISPNNKGLIIKTATFLHGRNVIKEDGTSAGILPSYIKYDGIGKESNYGNGTLVYDGTTRNFLIEQGGTLYDSNGRLNYPHAGELNAAIHFIMGSTPRDYGFFYYAVDKLTPLWWKGNAFVQWDGSAAGIIRVGTTSQRPTNGALIYVGFKYFDTDLGEPIFAKELSTPIVWVDSNGVVVTAVNKKRGGTTDRIALSDSWSDYWKTAIEGLVFYDTDLHKYVMWNGTDWVNLDGSTLV